MRGYLARRRYRACKRSAVRLQAAVRGYAARKRYRAVRAGVVRAQANFRAKRQRKRYLELKEELKRRSEVEKVARERAKAKAQREEQERASRAVAGVNHLEIPAELAFIFSKLDGVYSIAFTQLKNVQFRRFMIYAVFFFLQTGIRPTLSVIWSRW